VGPKELLKVFKLAPYIPVPKCLSRKKKFIEPVMDAGSVNRMPQKIGLKENSIRLES
jgi:hypothetical protein